MLFISIAHAKGINLQRLQKAFIKHATKLGLYDGSIVNLDGYTAAKIGVKRGYL